MSRSGLTWTIIIIVLILLGGGYWWYSQNEQGTYSTTTDASQTTQTGDGTDISENLALGTDSNATLGTYLIAYNGMTLYTFANDSVGTTTCYAACATKWPPYTVPAGTTLNLESGVNGQAATIARTDGTDQVTYNGMPLYFYQGDTVSEQTNGQGIGNVWFVVKP